VSGSTATPRFGLFARFGIELEYMIVEKDSLDVRPSADRLLFAHARPGQDDVNRGPIAWSNELAAHVIELKTFHPAARLAPLANRFQGEIAYITSWLKVHGLRLLPGAMHPWMRPRKETVLWPHGFQKVYAAFDHLFGCRSHGWSNLQSSHLNLPFRNAKEFERLHAAIRLVLPLIPAIAASSPYFEGRAAPELCHRLTVYRKNCRRVPSITGQVIPETIRSPSEYRRKILRRIYRDLSAHPKASVLRNEWVNARGAIARFHRNTIEIRLADVQECPAADLAIWGFVSAVLRELCEADEASLGLQQSLDEPLLDRMLRRTARLAGNALIWESPYLEALGLPRRRSSAASIVAALADRHPLPSWWRPNLDFILEHGTLAERLRASAGRTPTHSRLRETYSRLADALAQGVMFKP
jgi:gamma-glutamyl:cysteine ligase YbdK (ATP-grasp superfamily)